jgi:hypothetical protein
MFGELLQAHIAMQIQKSVEQLSGAVHYSQSWLLCICLTSPHSRSAVLIRARTAGCLVDQREMPGPFVYSLLINGNS